MSPDYIPFYIAITTMAGTTIVALLQLGKLKAEAKESSAKADSIIAEAARQLIEPYRVENKSLREEKARLEKECEALDAQLTNCLKGKKLRKQV